MVKIYTKVGDKGRSSLVGGSKVSKDDVRLHAYGTVDELNSVLGVTRVAIDRLIREKAPVGAPGPTDRAFDSLIRMSGDLEAIQNWLFDLGGLLACEPENRDRYKLAPVSKEWISWLEGRIDGADALLKPLKVFILPGGSEVAAQFHVSRTVARRAERHIVTMGDDAPENAIAFVNRLSDYLFTMARLCNHLLGIDDVAWKKHEAPPTA
jgi:cob(I)alamin adenosyltransferase